MLKGLIRSKVTRKVLAVLFTNPSQRFYMRQLERIIGEPINAVRRELRILENSQLLLSKEEGNVKYYWVNKRNPIFEDLKRIILKTQALGSNLRDLFKNVSEISVAFIYGSVAKNEENIASDLDVIIIGNIDGVKLHSEISQIEDKIKRTINYNHISLKEFRMKKTAFLKRVIKEKKIFLVGNKDDLQKLSR